MLSIGNYLPMDGKYRNRISVNPGYGLHSYILTGKRNAAVKGWHILHVTHKHVELTRILSLASGLFKK